MLLCFIRLYRNDCWLSPGKTLSMPPPFLMWGRGVHIVSPLSVRTSVLSVCPIRPVRNTNGFRVIYLLKRLVYWIEILYTGIGILDWNFICRYIIIKYRSRLIWGKIHQLFWELWSFFNFEKFAALKNGFRSISFVKIICIGFKLYTQVYNHKM